MKPKQKSQKLLSITRSKAKMYEFKISENDHISIPRNPANLLTLTIGLIGDLSDAIINKNEKKRKELQDYILFSAYFFDSYFHSKLNEENSDYIKLLGAVAYYLGNLPGSSQVLINKINNPNIDFKGSGIENLVIWLLRNDFKEIPIYESIEYAEILRNLSILFNTFWNSGTEVTDLINVSSKLRATAYKIGSPRELLLSDIACAVIMLKIDNSSWNSLPTYSNLLISDWEIPIMNGNINKELWPSQHIIGKNGILTGESAVIQMPTSAGKTKATEIIIRSGFLSNRVSVAVIIAPYRALCHEIRSNLILNFTGEQVNVDELSDALQLDAIFNTEITSKEILITTPEKLNYVLKHLPELTERIGLMIFDEGHQFDSGERGVTYELLLTSLKLLSGSNTQKILISAVLSNAEQLGEWLNGSESKIINGAGLNPTYRSIGFVSWTGKEGQIQYVSEDKNRLDQFYVPRVIAPYRLNKNLNERRDKSFPNKKSGPEIAIYLLLRLVSNGSVAIFCGRKDSITSLLRIARNIKERNPEDIFPSNFSDSEELDKMANLIGLNLGEDSLIYECAKIGIFPHHGDIPRGIRLSIETGMRESKLKAVICTSTLAQGVNLPIRYLIVSSIQIGQERISTRDFHNLIGRVGRAGMHTEGSVIFTNPKIYDNRFAEVWRWNSFKNVLDRDNSEPCASSLLEIFESIKIRSLNRIIPIDIDEFVNIYINDENLKEHYRIEYERVLTQDEQIIDEFERQIDRKINVLISIESFLLTNEQNLLNNTNEVPIENLVKNTLAYSLADTEKREKLINLFSTLSMYIVRKVRDQSKRKIFSKTLFGIRDSIDIEKWLKRNYSKLITIEDDVIFLDELWSIIKSKVKNKTFRNIKFSKHLKNSFLRWCKGDSYSEVLLYLKMNKVKIKGKKEKEVEIEDIVNLCDGAFSYEGSMIVGALVDFMELVEDDGKSLLENRLKVIQKVIKYGLLSEKEIILFELGLADREVVKSLQVRLPRLANKKSRIIKAIKSNFERFSEIVKIYPQYFSNVIEEIKHINV